MPTYYVALPADGGSNTNNGLAPTDEGGGVGPWADPGYASGQMAASGDICYVKSGTYVLTNTTAGTEGGPVAFTQLANQRAVMVGYETTPGDDTGVKPVIDIGATAPVDVVKGDTMDYHRQAFINLKVDGKHTAGVTGFNADGAFVAGCEAVNCASRGLFGGHFVNCKALDCNIGFYVGNSAFCWADSCTTGFDGIAQYVSCLATNNTNHGFGDAQLFRSSLHGCIAYGNGGSGFRCKQGNLSGNYYAYCVSANNGEFGFDADFGSMFHCYDFNNTLGRKDSTIIDFGGGTLANDPFPNAASGDYTIDSSPAGLVLRNVGIAL